MATYVLAEYEQEEFNKAVPVHGPGAQQGPAVGTARLSAFNMPDQIAVVVEDGDVIRFQLGYPNDEPPAPSRHPVADGIAVRVGRFSGKILDVEVRGARTRLSAGPLTFDPAAAEAWADGLPADRQFACRRNAQVVSMILREMPDDARCWALAHLSPAEQGSGVR